MERLFLVVMKSSSYGVHYYGFPDHDTAWRFYVEHRTSLGVEWAEFLGSTESEGMMRLGFYVPAGDKINANACGR